MPKIKPVGDCALTVEFENEISIPVNQKVHALDARLQALSLPGVVETVPTYRTLLKVEINDALRCDEVFSLCMGDDVEPRREFIEQNAKYATNLDI